MNRLGAAVIGCCLVALAAGPAGAQGAVDMSKFTCQQLTSGPLDDSVEKAVWLSGYYHGTRRNPRLDYQTFSENAKKVVAYCNANPKLTVMQAVGKLQQQTKR